MSRPQTIGAAAPERTEEPAGRKRALFVLVTVLVALALAVGTLEVLSWFFFRQRERADRDLRIFCPVASGGMPFGVKPHFTQAWAGMEFRVSVRTNGLGLREDFELPADQRIDVAALGDSFTFGHGVDAGARYSDVLRQYLGERLVVSLAYPDGWAPPHYYLYLREHPALVPRVAILGLFLGNDLSADELESTLVLDANGELVRIETPYRELDEFGHLVTRDYNPVTRLLRHTWSGRLLLHFQAQGAFEMRQLRPKRGILPSQWKQPKLDAGELDATAQQALHYVLAIRDLLRARDGELVVLLIPWSFYVSNQYPSPYQPAEAESIRTALPLLATFAEWCRANGLVCIDPLPALRAAEDTGRRTYFAADAHWTPAGHRVAADALRNAVRAALARTP